MKKNIETAIAEESVLNSNNRNSHLQILPYHTPHPYDFAEMNERPSANAYSQKPVMQRKSKNLWVLGPQHFPSKITCSDKNTHSLNGRKEEPSPHYSYHDGDSDYNNCTDTFQGIEEQAEKIRYTKIKKQNENKNVESSQLTDKIKDLFYGSIDLRKDAEDRQNMLLRNEVGSSRTGGATDLLSEKLRRFPPPSPLLKGKIEKRGNLKRSSTERYYDRDKARLNDKEYIDDGSVCCDNDYDDYEDYGQKDDGKHNEHTRTEKEQQEEYTEIANCNSRNECSRISNNINYGSIASNTCTSINEKEEPSRNTAAYDDMNFLIERKFIDEYQKNKQNNNKYDKNNVTDIFDIYNKPFKAHSHDYYEATCCNHSNSNYYAGVERQKDNDKNTNNNKYDDGEELSNCEKNDCGETQNDSSIFFKDHDFVLKEKTLNFKKTSSTLLLGEEKKEKNKNTFEGDNEIQQLKLDLKRLTRKLGTLDKRLRKIQKFERGILVGKDIDDESIDAMQAEETRKKISLKSRVREVYTLHKLKKKRLAELQNKRFSASITNNKTASITNNKTRIYSRFPSKIKTFTKVNQVEEDRLRLFTAMMTARKRRLYPQPQNEQRKKENLLSFLTSNRVADKKTASFLVGCGQVTVNGKTVLDVGHMLNTKEDKVCVGGSPVQTKRQSQEAPKTAEEKKIEKRREKDARRELLDQIAKLTKSDVSARNKIKHKPLGL